MIPGFFAAQARAGFEIIGITPGGANQETYSATLDATGAQEPVRWSIVSGSLPVGLHLAGTGGATAEISGVPDDDIGYYTARVRAESAGGISVERDIEIGVGQIATLLPFDQPNGATTFDDKTSRSWTRSGDAQVTTSGPLVGSGSLLLDGTGDFLQTNSAPELMLSTAGDFSFSAMVQSDVPLDGLLKGIFVKRHPTGGTSQEYSILVEGNDFVFIGWQSDTIISFLARHVGPFDWTEPTYVCAERKGNIYRVRVNDSEWVEEESTVPVSGAGVAVRLGSDQNSWGNARRWVGRIDEVRIVRGAVRGDGPIPTVPSDYPQPPAALAINGSLPAGVATVAYSSTTDVTIHGAAVPFSVDVVEGALPGDWTATVNGDHVEVAGSGVAAGAYTFTLEIEDDDNNTVELPLTVIIE